MCQQKTEIITLNCLNWYLLLCCCALEEDANVGLFSPDLFDCHSESMSVYNSLAVQNKNYFIKQVLSKYV